MSKICCIHDLEQSKKCTYYCFPNDVYFFFYLLLKSLKKPLSDRDDKEKLLYFLDAGAFTEFRRMVSDFSSA